MKPQSSRETSSPTISMFSGRPLPSPSSCAAAMYSSDIGSKPIIFAATASMATWSADASMKFLMTGNIVRGPGPLPAVVPSMIANRPVWISFWIASRSTSVSWIHECV